MTIERHTWRQDCSGILEPKGSHDDVFRDAARRLKKKVVEYKGKNWEKRFVVGIVYRGQRHEIWLSVLQVNLRNKEPLAGYLKVKCLS